ncbi:MAG TPA: hypothetical protein VG095_08820, partial [Chthoniobacterales bacterium]|nr:hypothetical protein [Chthoniobacterales bacterium]
MFAPSRRFVASSALLLLIARAASAQLLIPAVGFFADDVLTNPPPANYTAAPFLDNNASSAGNASSILSASASAGKHRALQVRESLSVPAALNIFDQHVVHFVFTEFTGDARVGQTRTIADEMLGSTQSKQAFVGNFNFYPNSGIDATRPAGQPTNSNAYEDSRGRSGSLLGNQIAAPALFPGSPNFRNPAASNSSAPNIRSALFTLPIQRITYAQAGLRGLSALPTGSAAYAVVARPNHPSSRLIPWVSRFNNWGNPALNGGPNGAGFVQNAATPSDGQLLSRGDFAALILHYRMRGADSVMLASAVNAGVQGYTDEQARLDVTSAWAQSANANGIFARANCAVACLNNVVGDLASNSGDVNPRSTEVAGVVWSGVYDRAGSVDPMSGRRQLVILLSNLGTARNIVDFPNNIGGFSVFVPPSRSSLDRYDDVAIDPGMHRILNFALQTSSRGRLEWVYTDDSPSPDFASNNRNGTGIGYAFPQPIGPSANITAPASICSPSSGNAASVPDAGNGATYSWSISGGTIESGQGTRAILFGIASGGSVVLTATVTDGNGASNTGSVTASTANASCTLAGTLSACANRRYDYASSAPAGATHSWSVTGNAVIVGAADGPTVILETGEPGSFEITDIVSLGNCQSTCSRVVPVRGAAPAAVIELVPDPIDPGSSGNIARTSTGYDGYFWQISDGGVINGPNTGPEISYSVDDSGDAVFLTLIVFKNN